MNQSYIRHLIQLNRNVGNTKKHFLQFCFSNRCSRNMFSLSYIITDKYIQQTILKKKTTKHSFQWICRFHQYKHLGYKLIPLLNNSVFQLFVYFDLTK